MGRRVLHDNRLQHQSGFSSRRPAGSLTALAWRTRLPIGLLDESFNLLLEQQPGCPLLHETPGHQRPRRVLLLHCTAAGKGTITINLHIETYLLRLPRRRRRFLGRRGSVFLPPAPPLGRPRPPPPRALKPPPRP